MGGCVRWNNGIHTVEGQQCQNRDFGFDFLGRPHRLWGGTQGKDLTASLTAQGPVHRSPLPQIVVNMTLFKCWWISHDVPLVRPCFQGPGFICRRINGNNCYCIHLPEDRRPQDISLSREQEGELGQPWKKQKSGSRVERPRF